MSDTEIEMARLQWRCRRGMLELDLLLQGFLKTVYPSLSRAEQACFVSLLELSDQKLSEYLLEQTPVSEKEFAHVIERIRAAAAD